MHSRASIVIIMGALFAVFHIIVVAVPMLASGVSGESQAFAAAIVDLPIFWLLGLFPAGRAVLYGSSPLLYILAFVVGGTLMYAGVGAMVGGGIRILIRAYRAS